MCVCVRIYRIVVHILATEIVDQLIRFHFATCRVSSSLSGCESLSSNIAPPAGAVPGQGALLSLVSTPSTRLVSRTRMGDRNQALFCPRGRFHHPSYALCSVSQPNPCRCVIRSPAGIHWTASLASRESGGRYGWSCCPSRTSRATCTCIELRYLRGAIALVSWNRRPMGDLKC